MSICNALVSTKKKTPHDVATRKIQKQTMNRVDSTIIKTLLNVSWGQFWMMSEMEKVWHVPVSRSTMKMQLKQMIFHSLTLSTQVVAVPQAWVGLDVWHATQLCPACNRLTPPRSPLLHPRSASRSGSWVGLCVFGYFWNRIPEIRNFGYPFSFFFWKHASGVQIHVL